MTVTLDKSGRVLIPKALRERLGLRPGDALALQVREEGDGAPALELRPEPEEPTLVREGALLVHTGKLPPDFDTVAFIRQQREERARRVAGLD